LESDYWTFGSEVFSTGKKGIFKNPKTAVSEAAIQLI